jgi:hypothetical protein
MDTTTSLTLCNRKGREMVLYYDTAVANDCATPVWVANKAVTGDLDISDTIDKEEQTSRDPAVKYKQYSQSQSDLEITGEMFVDPLYEGYSFMTSMKQGVARNILILTYGLTVVGSVGYKGKFNNYDGSIKGPESGPGRTSFSLAPAACVLSACNITTVEVAVANAIASYDEGVFVPAGFSAMDMPTLGQQILESEVYKGLNNTKAEIIYTDVTPLIALLGVDKVDSLLDNLTEATYVPTGIVSSRRMAKLKPRGMGEFHRADLVKVLDEIVMNDKKSVASIAKAAKTPKDSA